MAITFDSRIGAPYVFKSPPYYPGVVTTAFDLYAPVLNVPKVVTNLTNPDGPTRVGDVLEFTLVIRNTAGETATELVVTDAIPASTTFLAGSLQSTFGRGVLTTKTDLAGDDSAEYDAVMNRIVYRVGAGATALNGGSLAIGEFSTVRFLVTVDAGTPQGTDIVNQAGIAYAGLTTGTALVSSSTTISTVVREEADLGVTLTSDNSAPDVGDVVTFTVTLGNSGPSTAGDVLILDLLPANLTYNSSVAQRGTYTNPRKFLPWSARGVAGAKRAERACPGTTDAPGHALRALPRPHGVDPMVPGGERRRARTSWDAYYNPGTTTRRPTSATS